MLHWFFYSILLFGSRFYLYDNYICTAQIITSFGWVLVMYDLFDLSCLIASHNCEPYAIFNRITLCINHAISSGDYSFIVKNSTIAKHKAVFF